MTFPADTTEAPAKKRGPGLALSILTIIVGTIVGIAGLAIGINKISNDFKGTVYVAPHTVEQTLTKGTFNLYEAVQADNSTTPLVNGGITSITVTAPDQSTVRIDSPSSDEYYGQNGVEYYAKYTFRTPVEGTYTIDVEGAQGEPFFVNHSFGDLFRRAAGWFAMMGAGILIGLAGVIMLIVGIVRRRGDKRRAQFAGFPQGGAPGYPVGGTPPGVPVPPVAPGSPPPGWYPDPQLPGTNRYWDGARWTDQTQSP